MMINSFIIQNENLIHSLCRKKYSGNEYLFEYVNIFDRDDLFQDVCLALIKKNKEEKDRDFIVSDIYNIVSDIIKSAKARKKIANTDTFTGYGIIEDDHIEKYINHFNGVKIGRL